MSQTLLCLLLVLMLCLLAPAALAGEETARDALDTNLILITTADDFALGELSGLAPDATGDGALVLAEGETEGTFTSPVYAVADFYKMVASWSAAIGDGASVEVQARALTDGAWDDWFSWGEYGFSFLRRSVHGSIDEYQPGGTITQAQFRAILRRDGADVASPMLRQLAFSVKGVAEGDIPATYAETPVETLPASCLNPAPAYSQGIRDPEIADSICSPCTVSVLLNARDPSLDILPEELALSLHDGNYGFGNWSFSTSAAGLYGYNVYVQYASKDILLQELVNGRSAGLSVSYYTDADSEKYLEGAWGSTGGHLIAIVGYEYEDGVIDDEHLYFYASDTFSADDATSFHRYAWTQLDKCWDNRVLYHVSSEPEAGAQVTGVQRFEAALEEAGANEYALTVAGEALDLTRFTTGKTATLGHGVLAYTIEGFSTDASAAGSASVEYPERIQVGANNTFYYDLDLTDDGHIALDAGDVLARRGVPEGEERQITVYAMANNGRRYTAALTAQSRRAEAETAEEDAQAVQTEGNLIHVDVAGTGTLSEGVVRDEQGGVTLAEGTASGVYTTPVYESTWDWEYLMATLGAVTPGASSAELEARVQAQEAQGAWSDWMTWGEFGAGVQSMSGTENDGYVEMNTDLLYLLGDSSVANARRVQLRVTLRADEAGNAPVLFGLSYTIKKAAYSADEAVYTGQTAADALPASASVDILPTSSYGAANGSMAGWNFENMMLMMLDSQGADLLFEEVALNGYDYSVGWGNWAYTIFKAGLFGHEAYTQYGATPDLVRQAIADGNIVGLYVDGGAIPTTNNGDTSQVVVYGYETAQDGTVTFDYVCTKGDVSELEAGAVLGRCTQEELAAAIAGYGNANPKGAMYVVGKQVRPSSVTRVPVETEFVDATTVRLLRDGQALALPADFNVNTTSVPGRGMVMYTLASEVDESAKLAAGTFYYRVAVTNDGALTLPMKLEEALAEGDTANLYVVCNNGVTYTATLTAP